MDTVTTVTRRTHHRGQHVRIETRSGESYTGTIVGWGAQQVVIAPTDGGRFGWKHESHAAGTIARVVEVPR